MIICGVLDNSLRERMLREPVIDLKKAIELGQAAEESKMHVKQLTEKCDSSVDKVTKARKKKQVAANGTSRSSKHSAKQEKPRIKSINNCKFCAGSQRCHTGNRKNHFAKCWRQTIDRVKNEQDSY